MQIADIMRENLRDNFGSYLLFKWRVSCTLCLAFGNNKVHFTFSPVSCLDNMHNLFEYSRQLHL